VTYRSVVVGTDGSPTAAVAVRHAAELAKAFGARLTVVSAYSGGEAASLERGSTEVPAEMRWMLTDAGQADDRAASGRTVALEVGVEDVSCRVQDGDPATVLLDVADDVGADLLVVGSKGMSTAARFLLGSVANKVSHHSPCDLIIVHTAP
jgi:nucleotide-binding universal stress UspA family protein